MSDIIIFIIGTSLGVFISAFWLGATIKDREAEVFNDALKKQRKIADAEIDRIIEYLKQMPTEYCEPGYNQGIYDAIRILERFRKNKTRWGI